MKKWLHRIRGAVGMGLTWAAAWFGLPATVGLVGRVLGLPIVTAVGGLALGWGQIGFVGGAIFSLVLGIAGRRRRFDEMSIPRFAVWGALGGLLLSMPIVTVLDFAPLSLVSAGVVILLSAGSAAGSLALARRADDRELLEAGEEALGLTEGGYAQ